MPYLPFGWYVFINFFSIKEGCGKLKERAGWTKLKGMNFDHNFYVMFVNNFVQEMPRRVTNKISLYKLTKY